MAEPVGSSEPRLLAFLQSVLPPDAPRITPATPLFGTGLLDSLAIVHLVVWVEEQTGQSLNPRSFNIRDEWTLVADVARFIDRARRKPDVSR